MQVVWLFIYFGLMVMCVVVQYVGVEGRVIMGVLFGSCGFLDFVWVLVVCEDIVCVLLYIL